MVDSPHHPEMDVVFALGEAGVIDPEEDGKKKKKATTKKTTPEPETVELTDSEKPDPTEPDSE